VLAPKKETLRKKKFRQEKYVPFTLHTKVSNTIHIYGRYLLHIISNIPAATFHASYRGYMLGMGEAGHGGCF
jgi:hypothetical protein